MPAQQPAGFVPDGFIPDQVKAAPAPPPSRDFKVFGVNIHVPADEKPRLDSNIVGWGSNGAGIAPEDALMTGQAVRGVARAASGEGVGVAARAIAAAKAAVAEAAPVAKYEVAHHALKFAGLPDAVAIPMAMVISGYRKGGKAVAAEGEAAMVEPPKDMNAPHLDRSAPMRPSEMTEQQLAERLIYGKGAPSAPAELRGKTPQRPVVDTSMQEMAERRARQILPDIPPADGRVPTGHGTQPNNLLDEAPTAVPSAARGTVSGGTPPPAGPPPSPVPVESPQVAAPPATAANYPQKFLNEVAIQARRQKVTLTDADYAAARQLTQEGKTAAEAVAAIAPPAAPPAAPKPRLTSAEASAYMRLRASGKTDAEAKAAIETARAFQEQFGLTTPTTAETKFPKGMRGKANPPSVPPRAEPEPPVAAPVEPAAVKSAADWADEMSALRESRPRPIDKLYGKNGPTPEQAKEWAEKMRSWNRAYREASKQQKIALERDNAAFYERQRGAVTQP